MTAVHRASAVVLTAVLAVTACAGAGSAAQARSAPAAGSGSRSAAGPGSGSADGSSVARGAISKVLVIAEENHEYGDIIGSADAPYLTALAAVNGTATHLDAGYPVRCPSLAAYILLTSGSTGGICDDRAPKAHQIYGDNLFHQVLASGREWRNYAETAPGNCAPDNSADSRYLVRHVPATYYVADRRDCARWAVPMGTPAAGALHHDIAAGTLPAFGFLSPDACHDMHGAPRCPLDRVGKGDRWLHKWLPAIVSGPDYRAGRVAIIITWDEGTNRTNHIPTVVISPATRRVVAAQAYTHCSTLRTIEEVLRLPLLGCARTAASMVPAFHL
jgi:hypothetical protein